MSFSDIASWLGTAATDVGGTIGKAAGSLKDMFGSSTEGIMLKNPATGILEAAPKQNFWSALAGVEKSPLAQLIGRNVKLGGAPIRGVSGQGSILRKPKVALGFKGGPALQTGGGLSLDEKDLALIRKIGEDYAKARSNKAAYKAYQEGYGKTPSWSAAAEEAYGMPSYEPPTDYPEATEFYGREFDYTPTPIDWDEYSKFYYGNHPEY